MKKELLFVFAVVAVLLVGFVVAQELPKIKLKLNAEDITAKEVASLFTDSRVVDVDKPCRADEVSVYASATGTGSTCIIAALDCQEKLADQVYGIADILCGRYKKAVKVDPERCSAYRGNFNPDEDVEYGACEIEDHTATIKCYTKSGVKYTCN